MSRYRPVMPREHEPSCRRGLDPAGGNYGADPARCRRCRALLRRLRAVGELRRRRSEVTS